MEEYGEWMNSWVPLCCFLENMDLVKYWSKGHIEFFTISLLYKCSITVSLVKSEVLSPEKVM